MSNLRRQDIVEILTDKSLEKKWSEFTTRDGSWLLPGVGPVEIAELAELVQEAVPPEPLPWLWPWQRHADELVAYHAAMTHLAAVREACEQLVSQRHAIMKSKFMGIRVMDRIRKERANVKA